MGSTKFKLTCPEDLSYCNYQVQLLSFYRNKFKSIMLDQNKVMTEYLTKQNMEMAIPWHCSRCNRYGGRIHHYRNWHLNGKCQTAGKLNETLQLAKKLAFNNYGIIHNLIILGWNSSNLNKITTTCCQLQLDKELALRLNSY